MMQFNRFLNLLIELYYLLTAMLCLLVLGYSALTRVVWRRAVANDLFDVLPERMPLLLVSMLLVILALSLIWHSLTRRHGSGHSTDCHPGGQCRRAVWIYIALAWAFLLSLFCILSVRGLAVNDGGFLDECINEFMQGDYSSLSGGYLTTYPFQIGYVMFGQILYLMFGPSNYLVYQLLNIGSILLTVWFLHRMAYEMWEREDVADLTAVLSLGAVVLYCYATLVYNDIWSLAPQMAAVYLTMRYIRTGRRRMMAGGVACIAVACVLKTNCYIALVAIALSLLLAGFREMAGIRNSGMDTDSAPEQDGVDSREIARNAQSGQTEQRGHGGRRDTYTGVRALVNKAFWAVFAVAFTMCAIRAVYAGYAAAAGLDAMPGGVPATAYYAMGMHQVEDDGCVKYGWYDGSNAGFLAMAGDDSALASALAMEDMRESIETFRETPKFLVKFYLMKFLQQWGDGTCSSMRQMEMTGRNVEPMSQWAEALLYGTPGDALLEVMNVFHTVIYLGAALYFGSVFWRCLQRRRGRRLTRRSAGQDGDMDPGDHSGITMPMSGMDPVIGTNEAFLVMFILGGMLFHEIWEASSRYVIRYYLSMLPIAAYGYAQGFTAIHQFHKR